MAEINYLQLTLDLVPWIVVYVLITLSLNLEYGYTGIPNFGKVLAVAAGAFFAGSLSGIIPYYFLGLNSKYDFYENHIEVMSEINKVLRQDSWLSIEMLIIMLTIATLAGASFGFIGSYPAIRLKEDYLGMTLLAMGEILVIFGYTYERFVGGTLGIFIPSFLGFVPLENRPYVRIAIYIGIGIAIYIIVRKFVNSPLGRVLRAIRDNENLAITFGKDIISYRKKIMIYAGAIAGLAGGLLILQLGAVIASSYTRYLYTFLPWIMIIVGGTANNLGAVTGAIIFVTSNRLIDVYKAEIKEILPFDVVWLTPIMLSILLILILMFRPQGLIPEKQTKTLSEKEIYEILNKYKKEMKVISKVLKIETKKKIELIDITSDVDSFVKESNVKNGYCLIFAPHATAAIIANENERGLINDIIRKIKEEFPQEYNWEHDRIDDNAYAHLASSFIGSSKVFPIIDGKLIRGTWQNIFLVELDGPRFIRNVVLQIIGE